MKHSLYQLRHKHKHSGGLTKALLPPALIQALNQVSICQSLQTAFGPEKEPSIWNMDVRIRLDFERHLRIKISEKTL